MLTPKESENLKQLVLELARQTLKIYEDGCKKGNAFAKAHLLQAQDAVKKAERELKQVQNLQDNNI